SAMIPFADGGDRESRIYGLSKIGQSEFYVLPRVRRLVLASDDGIADTLLDEQATEFLAFDNAIMSVDTPGGDDERRKLFVVTVSHDLHGNDLIGAEDEVRRRPRRRRCHVHVVRDGSHLFGGVGVL